MAEILITYKTAQQHTACKEVEAKIRASNSKRKNDPFNTFNWKYDTCIQHNGFPNTNLRRASVQDGGTVFAFLVATSRGVNWSARLEETPKECFDYWYVRGKRNLV